MTEPRRPIHLAVFLGLSAGAYAVSLAGVTALQSQSEASVLADRTPTVSAIAEISARNDALEAWPGWTRRRAAYQRAAGRLRCGWAKPDGCRITARSGLADMVGAIQGAARNLPSRARAAFGSAGR